MSGLPCKSAYTVLTYPMITYCLIFFGSSQLVIAVFYQKYYVRGLSEGICFTTTCIEWKNTNHAWHCQDCHGRGLGSSGNELERICSIVAWKGAKELQGGPFPFATLYIYILYINGLATGGYNPTCRGYNSTSKWYSRGPPLFPSKVSKHISVWNPYLEYLYFVSWLVNIYIYTIVKTTINKLVETCSSEWGETTQLGSYPHYPCLVSWVSITPKALWYAIGPQRNSLHESRWHD